MKETNLYFKQFCKVVWFPPGLETENIFFRFRFPVSDIGVYLFRFGFRSRILVLIFLYRFRFLTTYVIRYSKLVSNPGFHTSITNANPTGNN